jgi:addiction module HigA family antidote
MLTNGLPPIPPSEFLQEIVDDLNLTQVALAKALDISPMRVSHLLKGSRPITAEIALRLGCAFGQSSQYWLNLQTSYDLKMAQLQWQDSLVNVRHLTGELTYSL